ncbi:MAG: apolipoprotein N-acyltransferase [Actinobacteria bacterium]|nr:apolipoprotein N-acyltransferase [Actinomycetota bacterium]
MKGRFALPLAAAGGALAALALPPFRYWWLAPIGYAALAGVMLEVGAKARLRRAFVFFLTFFTIGLGWMVEFSLPGAVLLVLLETLLATLPVIVLPRTRGPMLAALPAVVMLGEAFRYRFPLGGLPMAGAALGQVDGPLLVLARAGGDFALVFAAAFVGAALCAIVVALRIKAPGLRRTATAALVLFVLLTAASTLVKAPRATKPIRVAYAQGGGVRGLRAVDNDVTDVYGNQLEATAALKGRFDLLVWPEDVIDLPGPIAKDPVRLDVGKLATELHTTLVAGVVEDFGADRFKNAAVAWDRSGKIVDRYDKVHRVPFGEYVPARGLINRLADLSAVPRDAFPGTGPGLLLTRHVELGVVISYEVFFADRAREAVRAGGEVLLVPTNASSFKGRQVPAQEVAAAQLRAVETGRDLVQAAPTGHSAFVDAYGNTSKVSKLGVQAVATQTLHRRSGLTPFVRYGDRPMIGWMLFVLVAAAVLDRTVKSTK